MPTDFKYSSTFGPLLDFSGCSRTPSCVKATHMAFSAQFAGAPVVGFPSAILFSFRKVSPLGSTTPSIQPNVACWNSEIAPHVFGPINPSSTSLALGKEGKKSKPTLTNKATGGRVLPSRKIAISLRSGFLHARRGTRSATSAKVLFEIPNKVAPHSTVDTDSF